MEIFVNPGELRQAARSGAFTGHTGGQAPGFVQGNVAILPAALADDFRVFCERNPKPCPLLAMSKAGDWSLPELGDGIDIRTDVPRYRVYRDGEQTDTRDDLQTVWHEDLVTFVLGCSFSFEEALVEAGLHLRHVDENRTVPMYRTNIATQESGAFGGGMVVSMRPFAPEDAERAREITARFPRVHGAPIHVGEPAAIGIDDIARPDFGSAVTIQPDEVPVFWACGVTPQVAIEQARPALCITHEPGAMLVTDLRNEDFASGA
ncbi:MAG: putative hydro-lyase [Alphaproteobacteria bacterium]|jgi:uncharacterized protein YcsI (UPF0317 family)|nr:putative hydro-lyase [Rhodospirillaceae bacterium]MBT6203046.1 putative hydro-lyase [Rhodospirillaceae bacterium]MBT6510930.1 putative hydro-lyase [Rhodospirillaceae bacterium]MBT7645843.1 putative hydro-lyase [Rhodospirillaceae bacterium]MDG2480430.1 putative hydro-lyase [Alphaproteobacteria bacterium]